MKTTKGPKKADVIYRRIGDSFLDPKVFNPYSMLGVPSIFSAYKNHNVAFANALGIGVADDKVIYAYVHKVIKYYLGQEAIIPNVPTYICSKEKKRKYVLENLWNMVVKAANQFGWYRMLGGPAASKSEIEKFREKITKSPRGYLDQPVGVIKSVDSYRRSS